MSKDKRKLVDLDKRIHRGLSKSWGMSVIFNDDTFVDVKPEYLATVYVAEAISESKYRSCNEVITLEKQVKEVATECFSGLPKPRLTRRLRSRSGKKKSRERVDICISEDDSVFKTTRAIVELKLTSSNTTLTPDLLRNKRFLELRSITKPNTSVVASLGFIVVDPKSSCSISARMFRAGLKSKYEQLANQFSSTVFDTRVTVKLVSNPPRNVDELGVYKHICTVVISFIRK